MTDRPTLRADLHVHSYHSGYAVHLSFLRTRDCYSDPEAVYRVAKARGMDLVTITDHDSINGCLEFLDRHPDAPDFFISEEIECRLPDRPLKIHIGAYDINERVHAEAQRLRANVFDVVEFLRSEQVCFALNHPFFFYRPVLPLDEYVRIARQLFDGFEMRNGAMLPQQNELAAQVFGGRADSPPRAVGVFGGSDSHTLRRIGTTYTETEGRTREDFLRNLRAGRATVGGRHGTTWDIAAEIYGVIGNYWLSLLGFRRHDLSWTRRALGIGWSIASLPVDFIPLLIAALQKSGEARHIAACRRQLSAAPAGRAALDVGQLENS